MLIDPQNTSPNYHHGNVKEALLDAAQHHIESNNGEMISLRGLSKEVGVTPSAVYNHFADKNTLMLAIKLRIYGIFNDFFEENCVSTKNPEQSLLEMCLAYFHFSRRYPAQFRFLFSSSLPKEWSTKEIVDVSGRSIVKTRRLILDIHNEYKIQCSEEEVVNVTLLLWSQLHGIVMLRNSGSIAAAVSHQNWPSVCALSEDVEVEKLIESHIRKMVTGIRSSSESTNQH